MEKTIQLHGIQRAHDGINTDNGSCDEIINLRKVDGQWRLIGPKEELYDLSGLSDIAYYSKWYKHPVLPEGSFIAYKGTVTKTIVLVDATGTPSSTTLLTLSSAPTKIYHFGNILIVNKDINSYFFKYDTDAGTYTKLPDIEHGVYAVSDIDKTYIGIASTAGYTSISESLTALRSKVNQVENDGYFCGHTFFRIGFELFDGSIIMPSGLYYFLVGGIPPSFGSVVVDDLGYIPSVSEYSSVVSSSWGYLGKPKITLNFTSSQITNLQLYDGIINNIVIYMSKPVPDRNINTNEDELSFVYNNGSADVYMFPQNEAAINCVEKLTSFYYVHGVSIGELSTTQALIIDVGDVNMIETKEVLEIDNFTSHKIFSDVLYEYNSRLHIGNPTIRLSDGHNVSIISNLNATYSDLALMTSLTSPVYGGTTSNVFAITKLIINDTDKYVIKEYDSFAWYKDGSSGTTNYIFLNPVISYPDARAVKTWFVRWDTDHFERIEEYDLIKHPFLNLAYSVSDFHKWENSTYSAISFRVLRYKCIDLTPGTTLPFTENNTYIDTNRIQVSKLNNPFYYPAINSYRIGRVTNEIKGIISQALPMSEGQYGYYPLMVFSEEGILSLEQGTGDILYSSIQPVALDVLNNIDNLMAVKGGILFSSDKGLMVLSGREVNEISQIVEGDPKSDIKSEAYYVDAIDGTASVVDLEDSISVIDFKDYITSSIIAYDHIRDEIIISNNGKDYSFVYSLIEKVWYKLGQSFEYVINNHPNNIVVNDGILSDIYTEDTGNEFLIKTNPFKFETSHLKTIEKLIVRARTDITSSSIGKLALFLYGSLDGKEWVMISGFTVTHDSDVVSYMHYALQKVRTTCRYFVLFMASEANDVVISDIDFDVIEKQGGKLR